jgi:hypothetical protein
MSKFAAVGVCSALAGAAVATYVIGRRAAAASATSSVGGNEEEGDVPPPEIEDEVWSRNKTFFGDDGFAAIRGSFVVVVGLGGVGSHAAHMLARSGVGAMRVVDFDQVNLQPTSVSKSTSERRIVGGRRKLRGRAEEIEGGGGCDRGVYCTGVRPRLFDKIAQSKKFQWMVTRRELHAS